MNGPIEPRRRKPGARGIAVRLADGQDWLLAEPVFRPGAVPLTTPEVDAAIDRFHEQVVLGDDVWLADVLAVARSLLRVNYELSDVELADLLEVDPGSGAEALAGAVLGSLFGVESRTRSYADWVRASFLANGLTLAEIPASAVGDVLSILIATRRTVPAAQFVDASRAALDRESLERLV